MEKLLKEKDDEQVFTAIKIRQSFHKLYPVNQKPLEPVLCALATERSKEDDGRGGLKTPLLKN